MDDRTIMKSQDVSLLIISDSAETKRALQKIATDSEYGHVHTGASL